MAAQVSTLFFSGFHKCSSIYFFCSILFSPLSFQLHDVLLSHAEQDDLMMWRLKNIICKQKASLQYASFRAIKDFFHLKVFSYNVCTETEDQHVLVHASCAEAHHESACYSVCTGTSLLLSGKHWCAISDKACTWTSLGICYRHVSLSRAEIVYGYVV